MQDRHDVFRHVAVSRYCNGECRGAVQWVAPYESDGCAPDIGGSSDVGCVRTSNEDALLIADVSTGTLLRGDAPRVAWQLGTRGGLLAVSERDGGEQAEEVASAVAVEALARGS